MQQAEAPDADGDDSLADGLGNLMQEEEDRPQQAASAEPVARVPAMEGEANEANRSAGEHMSPEVRLWFRNYKEKRVAAQKTPNLLTLKLPSLELAPASQAVAGVQRHAVDSRMAEVQKEAMSEVLKTWLPTDFKCGIGHDTDELVLFQNETKAPETLADAMDELRQQIDVYFGWAGKCLDAAQKQARAAAQATLVLLEYSSDDGRNELLQTKLFTLLMDELYRSHGEKLFECVGQGAWIPASHGISSISLEFVLGALRRAQAYFLAMSKHAPKRDFHEVAFDLRVMQSLADEAPLLEWQLNDVQGKTPQTKARNWFLGHSELCRDLRKQFSEHNKNVLKNFHRWADCDMSKKQQPGLCFRDAYLSTADGKLKQLAKDPRRGCYIMIDKPICFKPSDLSRNRLAGLLLSSFAGGDGLKLLLSQCALVACRMRQPDVMLVFVGEGHDGKTMILVDLMSACWGSGFGNPPSTMLQVDREFQQQGLNFLHCVLLTFDECRRDQGLVEDLMKVFLGGGKIPLRRNHEAETKYGSFQFVGRSWNLNAGDIPHVATAQEKSNARRYRATFMRSTITNNPEEVSVTKKVFFADPDAKAFCGSPDAVWTFFNDFLWPFMRQFSPQQWSDNLEFMPAKSQMKKDTTWFLQRMDRSIDSCSPDENGRPCASVEAAVDMQAKLVRETHAAIKDNFFPAHTVNRACVPSNPGATKVNKGQNVKLRSDYLAEAIINYPHLLRLAGGHKSRFERRPLDLQRMDKVLAEAVGERMVDVFGTWSDWQWPVDQSGEDIWDDVCEGAEPPSFENGPPWDVKFRIDVQGLREYVLQGTDPRQEQVEQFLQLVDRESKQDAQGTFLRQDGRQKVVAGHPMGRFFFPWLSYPNLSKAARAAASPAAAVEFDQPNAIVRFIIDLAEELGVLVPLFKKYYSHKSSWRNAVMKYMDLDLDDAKRLLTKATFGFAHPLADKRERGVLPILSGLAAESAQVRAVVCDARPELLGAMVKAGRPRPGTSCLAFVVFDRENDITRSFWAHLLTCDWLPVGPVYDAVVATPHQAAHDKPATMVADMYEQTSGIKMQTKSLKAPSLPQHRYLVDVVADLMSAGKAWSAGEVKVVSGAHKCLAFAVVNLFSEDEDVADAFDDSDGPMTYRQCQDQVNDLLFDLEKYSPEAAPAAGRYIVHESRVAQPFGNANAIEASAGQIRFYAAGLATVAEMQAATFWGALQDVLDFTLLKVRRVQEPKKKKARQEPQAFLDLLAGGPDQEDDAFEERISALAVSTVQDEVKREVERLTALKRRSPGNRNYDCRFCPFRSFSRSDALLAHIQKYHTVNKLFLASHRSEAQWNVVLALFEQDQAILFS